ncbi:protein of unknown function [Pseudorhizobium banfieldiae]|uniref:Uncharacterized protein n=1 Tax=Pseudorhizobium banfieldiae TaxID=1125847 RepID=L0NAY5_9HYPH|nr:protein of unknown function [Pseudorhizobium banfieldiae]
MIVDRTEATGLLLFIKPYVLTSLAKAEGGSNDDHKGRDQAGPRPGRGRFCGRDRCNRRKLPGPDGSMDLAQQ